jgi:signal transduction histidine kinase
MTSHGVWARRRTLRARLTLLATALVSAVLLASAIALVEVQQNLLTRGVDEALVQRADNMQSAVIHQAAGSSLPGEGDREDSFIQVVDQRGRVLASSANVASLAAVAAPPVSGARERLQTTPVSGLSLHAYRVLARRLSSDPAGRTLVVGKNLDDVDESVKVLTTSLSVSLPVAVALLATTMWWLTGRVLRPVEEIRREVASITGSELHRRVPVPHADDEISRLARTMNAMLERVQHATDRQQQFVADASHELRNPLTRIRSTVEVAMAHPQTLSPSEACADVLADTAELQQLVDDLLFLARSESGRRPEPFPPVDLDDLVLAEASRLKARSPLTVDVSAVSAARVSGDARQLARAIANVVENAERHAATTIRFGLSERNGQSELDVSDDGPGIPEEHRRAVFTRFTRLDPSRSREGGGAGLGLAIVLDIVTRHHGTVAISSNDPSGTRLTMSFPRAE